MKNTLLNVRDRTPFREQLAPHCEGGEWQDTEGFRVAYYGTDAFGHRKSTAGGFEPLALYFGDDKTPILEMRRVTNANDTAVFFTDGWVALIKGTSLSVSRLRRR